MLTNCEELKSFFVNAVKNPNIPNYENRDSLAENTNDPIPNAIVKWRNHPYIFAIASKYENRANFSFNFVFKEDVIEEIKLNIGNLHSVLVDHAKDIFIGLGVFNKLL